MTSVYVRVGTAWARYTRIVCMDCGKAADGPYQRGRRPTLCAVCRREHRRVYQQRYDRERRVRLRALAAPLPKETP